VCFFHSLENCLVKFLLLESETESENGKKISESEYKKINSNLQHCVKFIMSQRVIKVFFIVFIVFRVNTLPTYSGGELNLESELR
jgi:hypothetical protein